MYLAMNEFEFLLPCVFLLGWMWIQLIFQSAQEDYLLCQLAWKPKNCHQAVYGIMRCRPDDAKHSLCDDFQNGDPCKVCLSKDNIHSDMISHLHYIRDDWCYKIILMNDPSMKVLRTLGYMWPLFRRPWLFYTQFIHHLQDFKMYLSKFKITLDLYLKYYKALYLLRGRNIRCN